MSGTVGRLSEAVVLMAGAGSRLQRGQSKAIKPLTPLLGRPLISYTFEALAQVGITTVHAIVGFEMESLMAQVGPLAPSGLRLNFVENPDWRKQNGLSVLAAAPHVRAPFLLTMSDHLFDHSAVHLLARDFREDELNLAVDRKLDSIFDPDDAMKVQTKGDRIIGIGKNLSTYDAIDTGLFVCPFHLFDHLEAAKQDGDCSLADGVRTMAAAGQARVIDIGEAWWQDVDTPEMLRHAGDTLRLKRRELISNAGYP